MDSIILTQVFLHKHITYIYMMLQEKLVEIEDCLSKRRWVKHCLRVNIVPAGMIKECNTWKVASARAIH